ncbi:MAG: SH3 domain-containing protein [Pseudomonadota bacterium]
MRRAPAISALLLMLAAPAWALDFVSTRKPAILYDAPSSASGKVAVISAGYPLEKLITLSGWTKVRDDTGQLAWIEEAALVSKRTLLVRVPEAQVLENPRDDAALRFRAARGVLLDLLSDLGNGWARVQHAGGQQGYVRIRDVWGL